MCWYRAVLSTRHLQRRLACDRDTCVRAADYARDAAGVRTDLSLCVEGTGVGGAWCGQRQRSITMADSPNVSHSPGFCGRRSASEDEGRSRLDFPLIHDV